MTQHQSDQSKRLLRVFLCHSSADKQIARDLFMTLRSDGMDPWLDEEKLLPGQDWQYEIRQAIKASDIALVCLSTNSVTKVGFVQKEIKHALDVADELPIGTIFVIPLKLDECDVPDRLQQWQWISMKDPEISST